LNKVGINNFPLDFNKFNSDLFTLDNKDIIFNDSIVIENNTLKIKKNMYKVINPVYISTGFWAVYFNDHFQYSSSMDLNSDKTEALGYHYFSYRFDSSKELYLRIIYSFTNIKTSEIEYFIDSELINIQ